MERRTVRGVAVEDAVRRAAGGLPRLRFRLGALAVSRQEAGWFAGSLAAAMAALVVFIRLATLRWQSFETNAFDLAFFDQIIFNTSQGRLFETSFVAYNFAGQHFEPILFAYVPAYWLGAGPYFLTVSQATVAAVAAVPLYGFARTLTRQPAIAFAAVVAYLANPYLHRAIAFDFHPEVTTAFPVFLAAWAIVAPRRRLAVVASLSVLLFKEDTVFLVLLLAGVMWSRDLKREAKVTAAIAVAYAALAVLVFMPLIRGGEGSDLVERYGYLLPGHAGNQGFVGLIRLPVRAAEVALHPDQVWTGLSFLVVGSAIAVCRPVRLVWLVPGMLLALLSTHPPQRQFELHYAAEMVPAVIILGTMAADSLKARLGPPLMAVIVAAPTVLAMLLLSPLVAGHSEPPSARHRAAVHAALAYIPDDADVSVSAQSGLLPRLSQRREAHEFPGNAARAEWIVVDRYGFRSSQSLGAGFDEEIQLVRRTATLVFSEDGVEVFRRSP